MSNKIGGSTLVDKTAQERFLVTGAAGFIGFHVCLRLLQQGHQVFAFDSMTPYYDPDLKQARLKILTAYSDFHFEQFALEDGPRLERFVVSARADVVIHLAAQAGVRYSLEQPRSYIESNVVGTFNLLEVLRHTGVGHFLFASTSSVYGANETLPYAETQRTDFPQSLYAATKKASEGMIHSYSHLFGIHSTCFRFFTVYGPWGRPDMALFKFVRAMLAGDTIDVYGMGEMRRDFTFIDDLVDAIILLAAVPPDAKMVSVADSLSPVAPFRTVNIAGGNPTDLLDFIAAIERQLGTSARMNLLPMQQGDVTQTHADPGLLLALTGYVPQTPIEVGVQQFVEWFKDFYGFLPNSSDA